MQLKGIVFLPNQSDFPERLERDLILKVIQEKPETFIFILPEGHVFIDAISIDYLTDIEIGDLHYSSNFGLLDDLNRVLIRERVPNIFLNPTKKEEYELEEKLPEALITFVQLLNRVYKEFKVALVTPGNIAPEQLMETGRSIRESAERSESKSILVVFSDLIDSPNYSELVKTSLEADNFYDLINLKTEPFEKSQLEALLIGIGATDKLKTTVETFSKDNNYCYFIKFLVESVNLKEEQKIDFTKASIIEEYREELKQQRKILRENESILQKLVRQTIETFLNQGTRLNFNTFAELEIPDKNIIQRLQNQRTGAFVTIYKDGQFRGSMGTVSPVCNNIGEEVINNAIEAAFFDPSVVPITPDELDSCQFEIEILDPAEQIESQDELDPKKYGIIVEQGFKRGVVLPGIEEIKTAEDQIALAKQRGGIINDFSEEPLIISRFTTETF